MDDIFARLVGGPLAGTDQRDRRDIPHRLSLAKAS
jgi:hypothetical protein